MKDATKVGKLLFDDVMEDFQDNEPELWAKVTEGDVTKVLGKLSHSALSRLQPLLCFTIRRAP